MFLVMHDNGVEYYSDLLGIPVAVTLCETDAVLFLYDCGFEPRDGDGNFWKGTDRAWITKVDKITVHDLHLYDTIDSSGGLPHDVSTNSAKDTD